MGFFLPSVWLERRLAGARRDIENGLPDALDLLVVCIEAGSGIDQAIVKTGDELSFAYPALGEELRLLNSEIRAGKPRIEAFKSLAQRTKVEDVRTLVAMLIQTDRFGTSIGQALADRTQTRRAPSVASEQRKQPRRSASSSSFRSCCSSFRRSMLSCSVRLSFSSCTHSDKRRFARDGETLHEHEFHYDWRSDCRGYPLFAAASGAVEQGRLTPVGACGHEDRSVSNRTHGVAVRDASPSRCVVRHARLAAHGAAAGRSAVRSPATKNPAAANRAKTLEVFASPAR